MRKLFLILSILVAFMGQSSAKYKTNPWTNKGAWYTYTCDTNKIDVFYVVSTNVLEDSASNYATLTEPQRKAMMEEMQYVRNYMGDSVNFFAPFYHQLTLFSFCENHDTLQTMMRPVLNEVKDAFTYYLKHLNGGRDFVLMGFSQGAIVVLDLTKHLTRRQYSRLISTYMMGYRLSKEDLSYPFIRPAQDTTERGVTISFNTVTSPDGIWHGLTDGAAVCTNPLTWTTDTTSAVLVYNGDTTLLYVSPDCNVLLAPNITAEKYYLKSFERFCTVGNLHLGDLLFYLPNISTNIHQRKRKN